MGEVYWTTHDIGITNLPIRWPIVLPKMAAKHIDSYRGLNKSIVTYVEEEQCAKKMTVFRK